MLRTTLRPDPYGRDSGQDRKLVPLQRDGAEFIPLQAGRLPTGLMVICLLMILAVPAFGWAQGDALKHAVANPVHALAKTLMSFGAITALIILILALLVLGASFFPQFTERTQSYLRSHPFKCFIMGLVNILFLFALLILSKGILGIIILPIFFILSIFGLISASEDLGSRIAPLMVSKPSRLTRLILGWLTLALAGAIPLLGWFVIFPWRLLSGCGAFIIALFAKNTPPE